MGTEHAALYRHVMVLCKMLPFEQTMCGMLRRSRENKKSNAPYGSQPSA
jgi:hypothetical protein